MSEIRACQRYCDTCMNGILPDHNYPCDECEASYDLMAADTPKHYRPTLGKDSPIKDSGDRTEFTTGAVRDMHEGKGRCDLLPMCVLLRLARHYENGCKKYGDRNWEKGIPAHSFADSAMRHIFKYMDGQRDEDHLIAAICFAV